MSRVGTHSLNPLARGFYTVPEAARIVEGGNTQRIYGWLKGYPRRAIGPLLTRDYVPIDDRQELSFLDLVEVRFVEHFRSHNVKMRTLRIAADELRKEFEAPHPFATDRVHLVADKADVFLEIMRESAKQEKDKALLSLTTKNYVMEETIKRYLVPGIVFDRESHLADRFAPRPARFPKITVDPRVAHGQPAGEGGIPTNALYEAWIAENESVDEVAYWFEVPAASVIEAVRFEQLLDKRDAVAA